MQGCGFDPWFGNWDPTAAEQISLCHTYWAHVPQLTEAHVPQLESPCTTAKILPAGTKTYTAKQINLNKENKWGHAAVPPPALPPPLPPLHDPLRGGHIWSPLQPEVQPWQTVGTPMWWAVAAWARPPRGLRWHDGRCREQWPHQPSLSASPGPRTHHAHLGAVQEPGPVWHLRPGLPGPDGHKPAYQNWRQKVDNFVVNTSG